MRTRNPSVLLATIVLLPGMLCTVVAARTIYVDGDATGANDGSSWANACNYLQDALAVAVSGDEIWVAKGIYKPDEDTTNPSGTGLRNATFKPLNGVAIKGGYAGFGSPDPNARDIKRYESVLSGDLDGNDVDVNSPVELFSEPTRGENSRHVVTTSRTDATAVLDGFTIKGGYDDFIWWCTPTTPVPEGRGAGVYNNAGHPTIINCTFSDNAVNLKGGAMFNTYADPTLINCVFKGNYADYDGGGVFNEAGNPRLTNCTLSHNWARYDGGGMASWRATPVLSGCIVSENRAEGGAGMHNHESHAKLKNCTFSGNRAVGNNGGIGNVFSSNPIISNCILWGNLNVEMTGSAVVAYSDVEGGWPGEGNIDEDPCFADSNNGDYHLRSEAGRWVPDALSWVQDSLTSPCIDAGNPGCRLGDEAEDGNNVRINMGAYGGTAEASKTPGGWRSIADLTNDWAVDHDDLAVFVGYWLESGECIPSDLDRSELVDFADFAMVGEYWLRGG